MPDPEPVTLSPDAACVASLVCYDASGNSAPAPATVVWSTDTPELISLSPATDGTAIVRGLSMGTARLTAVSGPLTATATIPVTPGVAVRAEIVLRPFAPSPLRGA